jgi:hypothetical protein
MIRVILILVIALIIYKIYELKNTQSGQILSNDSENFINITNPFVDGLSQYQLGSSRPDDGGILGMDDEYFGDEIIDNINDDPSLYDYVSKSNNVINKNGRLVKDIYSKKLNNDINAIRSLQKKSQQNKKINSILKSGNKSSLKKNVQFVNTQNQDPRINKPKKSTSNTKLNKFFMQSQFNDSYRDIMTSLNVICPDQKIIFNLQSLPVTTVMYDLRKELPPAIKKLVDQFVMKLNRSITNLPESVDILNTNNNYLPMTANMKKYVQDKGINKFYKDIGVDYNLYPDTPPNAPVELVRVLGARREFTEPETKYIITIVIKKLLESVTDQMKLTINFVLKNDPLEADNMFSKTITPRLTQQVAIEFIFIDGYYTNDYNADYDCYGNGEKSKKVDNNDNDDNFFSFDALGKDTMISDNEVITELNKKYREHEIEMANFNVNIPYPVYQNPADTKPPKFV